MTLITQLRQLISPPTPQSKLVGGASKENPNKRFGFGGKGDRQESIKRWMQIYRRGGPYADAVDAYWLFALSSGYTLVCRDGADALKEAVQAWIDQPHVDLDEIIKLGILSAKIAGDAYQEVIPTRGGGVWGVVTRDPGSFEKVHDQYGRITGYTQTTGQITTGLTRTPIDKDVVINLMIDQIPGDVYGLSILGRAEDDVLRDCDIIESVTKAIHRHGTPKQQWDLGPDATKEDFDAVETEMKKMDAQTDFATAGITINPLDTTGVSGVDTYSNVSLQRVACAMGVPEEMLGMGRGSTEATANVRMRTFLDKITTMQGIVASTYSRGLIDRITGVPGAVWIEFGDVDPGDEVARAEYINKVCTATPMDPFAIISRKQCQTFLGNDPEEWEEDEGMKEETTPEPPAE